jgi:hypothetical protein
VSANRIRSQIRARIRAGILPSGPNSATYARRGGTGKCACCDSAIGPHEVEYEVCFGSERTCLAHMNCYRIWREEWNCAADAQQEESA